MRPRAVRFGLAVLVAALSASPAAAHDPLPDLPDYVFAVLPREENLDVLVFGDVRPVLIRFRVQTNGRGFRTAWDEFAYRLHDYLDTNKDRVLTAKEARPGRWQQVFGNLLPFRDPEPPVATGDPAALDSDPRDGKVSVEELSRYLREELGYDAHGVQPGFGPDPLIQSAFVQLDRDGDGALEPAELAGAEGLIVRLDADEDEMVALAELRPHDNPYAGRFGPDPSGGRATIAAESDPIVPLTSAEVRRLVDQRLLTKYGAGAMNPAPGLVLDVRLGRRPRTASTLELATPADIAGPLAAKVQKTEEGDLVLDLDGTLVRLGLDDNVRDLRRFFEMRFSEADADKDGALDRKEAEKSRFIVTLFDPADRNGDEKLSRGEMTSFLDRSVDATESRLMVTASDSGRNVFDLLDADHDRRLGRRELRDAAQPLKGFDRDGDGRVALAELPRVYELRVGRGPSFRRRSVSFESYDDPPPSPSALKDALSWFRHMDRNHDGDVSPLEFLGTADDFRRLDADGDGLIDPKEAAKGP